MTAPSKESLEDYEAALGRAYASIDTAESSVEDAREGVEAAKDEARSLYDPDTAAGIFNGVLSDLNRAVGSIVDARNGLPALDEGDVDKA
jgi:hypothetical protein